MGWEGRGGEGRGGEGRGGEGRGGEGRGGEGRGGEKRRGETCNPAQTKMGVDLQTSELRANFFMRLGLL